MPDPIELELPGVYVDAIVLDATASPALRLLDCDPENAETGVPIASHIAFDLVDVSGTGVDFVASKAWVNGVLALSGGLIQAGFNGAGSGSSTPYTDCQRVRLQPTTAFTALQIITIRVTSQLVGGGSPLDETYSFTAEDVAVPRVSSASPRSTRVVRVAFDETVLHTSATGAYDALNPSNYTFTRLSVPAYAPIAVSVATVDDQTFDVTCDMELSGEIPYRVTVAGVQDLFGNEVSAPYDSADFTSLEIPHPAGRRWDLWTMLPLVNRIEDTSRALEFFTGCLQDVSDILLADVDSWTDILDRDRAAEQWLDAMLADLGNPFAFDLEENDKRRLLSVLISMYQQKGTAKGIENVVRFFLGLTIEVNAYWPDQTWVLGDSELVPEFPAMSGTNGQITAATKKFTTATGQFTPECIGQTVLISGATNPGNDGAHTITAVIDEDNVTLSFAGGPVDELDLTWEFVEGTDPARLGPGTLWGRYSFEILSAIALTVTQRAQITSIANYMKPAHTHLNRIVEPSGPVVYDPLELGTSELGIDWMLH